MTAEDIKQMTKSFAIQCARLCIGLSKNDINRNYSNQLIRSAASAAANYRAVRRAKSKPDFIHKLKIVEEELDESLFWIELLAEFNKTQRNELASAYKNGEEILKIIVGTINTMRKKS